MNDVLPDRVVMALFFFPRGGSAQVARYLGRALPAAGWKPTLVAGSLGEAGDAGNAANFFSGMDVRDVPYTTAQLHPSYEDRPGAPDPVFARVGDAEYEALVTRWQRALTDAGAGEADVLHIHHLTPVNEAAARSFPDVPVVGHLHGTELLMLRRIERGAPAGWRHARAWAERMRRWARACDRLLVLSPDAARRVPDELGVDPARVVWAPNGFDPEGFDSRPLDSAGRLALWRRWLVEEPRGWAPGAGPGSVAYAPEDLEPFARGGPVLLYVGRYTEVKRIPLLIRAHARAQDRFTRRAPLVILGGYPDEWEGPHPLEVIEELGARDVFLAGWHGHDDLPQALNAADLVVLPSVCEQFGQVLVEGMACGLPVIAVDRHGPASIVDDGDTGWLVPPDDEAVLAGALVEAVNDPDERERRGREAYRVSRSRYAWPELAHDVAATYAAAVRSREGRGAEAA